LEEAKEGEICNAVKTKTGLRSSDGIKYCYIDSTLKIYPSLLNLLFAKSYTAKIRYHRKTSDEKYLQE